MGLNGMNPVKVLEAMVSESVCEIIDGNGNPILANGDYIAEDGLIHCGTCKARKQTTIVFQGKRFHPRIMCYCEMSDVNRSQAEDAKNAESKKAAASIERLKELRRSSLMESRMEQSTFERFIVNEHNTVAFRACKRYADGFDEMYQNNRGMIFYGEPGTGKTFAAACIANLLLEREIPVVMTSFVKLLSTSRFGEEDQKIIDTMGCAKLLIIDDLGAERGSDFALERVYNIVDSRYRAKKPVIMTTNLSIGEMHGNTDKRYARIYDRVLEMCPFSLRFEGPSWRKVEAAKGFDDMRKLMEE